MAEVYPDIRAIFTRALELESAEEVNRFLDEVCGGDDKVRQEVLGLLSSHREAGHFLGGASTGGGTIEHAHIAERPGTVIGPYKLLQQIGEGGMGVVFMAEQERPVKRRVALKIIKPGMDTREVIARFEAERQALAMMDHPNIAKVFDAGATENGRPYFVMELVQGVPITEYCDQCNHTTRERLELFVTVCQAVQHAHQKGVIHRDIKPTNVLVAIQDGKPSPKIIDFGVAKAIGQQLTEHTLMTAFAQIVGTPLYMSPEQAELSPLGVDTRSDIYSLGVLLYELLTGSTPLDKERLHAASYDELRRIIREEEPPRPSARISTLAADLATTVAAHRRTDARRLRQTVRGELDWIVMKCLEKDRNRRYESAGSLGRDVERFLNDEPVQACPPSASYRLKKFVRRNRTSVLAGSGIAAALVFGLIAASIGFVQAREQAARADREAANAHTEAARSEQVAEFLKEMLAAAGPSIARGRDTTLLREILDRTSDRVEKYLQDQPEVQGDLYFTLGSAYADVGDYPRATAMYQFAVKSHQKAPVRNDEKYVLALARLGFCQSYIGNISAGMANTKSAVDLARQCTNQQVLASCLYEASRAFDAWGNGVVDEIPYIRDCLALREKLGNDPVAIADCMFRLGSCLREIDASESEMFERKALALHSKYLEPNHPKIANDTLLLGHALLLAAKPQEAEGVLQETLDRYHLIYDDNHPYRQFALNFMYGALVLQGKRSEAETRIRNAAEKYPGNPGIMRLLSGLHVREGQWSTVADQCSTFCESEPANQEHWLRLCVALLHAGREKEYQRRCHEFLNRVATTSEIRVITLAAKGPLLLPVQGEDFKRACHMADIAAEAEGPIWILPWTRLLKSLAEYRRGHFESAIAWADRSVSAEVAPDRCKASGYMIRSAACARLQRIDAAREALANGDRLLNVAENDFDFLRNWPDWKIGELLRREAIAIVNERVPGDTNQG
jgi:serine/threonine protein kinase/tetratricopeptide (TPR) repeat protein